MKGNELFSLMSPEAIRQINAFDETVRKLVREMLRSDASILHQKLTQQCALAVLMEQTVILAGGIGFNRDTFQAFAANSYEITIEGLVASVDRLDEAGRRDLAEKLVAIGGAPNVELALAALQELTATGGDAEKLHTNLRALFRDKLAAARPRAEDSPVAKALARQMVDAGVMPNLAAAFDHLNKLAAAFDKARKGPTGGGS